MSRTVLDDINVAGCVYVYEVYSFVLFLLLYIVQYAISWTLFIVGVWVKEDIHLILVSIFLWLNHYSNQFYQWVALAPTPLADCATSAAYCVARSSSHNACGEPPWPASVPADATCGGPPLPPCEPCVPCGMPALEVQLSAGIVMCFLLYAYMWADHTPRASHTALILLFHALVVYSHIYFGINDTNQILAGNIIGAVQGTLWNMFEFAVLAPHFDSMQLYLNKLPFVNIQRRLTRRPRDGDA